MLQSVLPVILLIAVASVAWRQPVPARARARKCASRRTGR
jgi:hypothetical protein